MTRPMLDHDRDGSRRRMSRVPAAATSPTPDRSRRRAGRGTRCARRRGPSARRTGCRGRPSPVSARSRRRHEVSSPIDATMGGRIGCAAHGSTATSSTRSPTRLSTTRAPHSTPFAPLSRRPTMTLTRRPPPLRAGLLAERYCGRPRPWQSRDESAQLATDRAACSAMASMRSVRGHRDRRPRPRPDALPRRCGCAAAARLQARRSCGSSPRSTREAAMRQRRTARLARHRLALHRRTSGLSCGRDLRLATSRTPTATAAFCTRMRRAVDRDAPAREACAARA